MTNPQTEARAILKGMSIAYNGTGGFNVAVERIATALAAKDAELAAVKENCETVCNSYADENQRLYDRAERAEAQLAAYRQSAVHPDDHDKVLAQLAELKAENSWLKLSCSVWEEVVRRIKAPALEAQGGENG